MEIGVEVCHGVENSEISSQQLYLAKIYCQSLPQTDKRWLLMTKRKKIWWNEHLSWALDLEFVKVFNISLILLKKQRLEKIEVIFKLSSFKWCEAKYFIFIELEWELVYNKK